MNIWSSWSRDWNNRSFRAFSNEPPDYLDGNGGPLFPTDDSYPQKSPLARALLGADGISLVSTWWRGTTSEGAYAMFQGGSPLRLGYSAGAGFATAPTKYTFDALMGDPTVRAKYPKPVPSAAMSYDNETGALTVTWAKSDEDVANNDFIGYKVYRAASLIGPWELAATISGVNQSRVFVEEEPEEFVYMIRAVKTENDGDPAREYENASTGTFATAVTIDGTGDFSEVHLKRHWVLDDGAIDGISVWIDDSTSNPPTLELDYRATKLLTITGNDDDNHLVVDHGLGTPVPNASGAHGTGGGIAFDGGAGSGDELTVLGSAGADLASFEIGAIKMSGEISYANTESLEFDGGANNDTLVFHGTSGADEVTFSNGLVELYVDTTYSSVESLQFDGKLGGDDVTITSGHSSSLPVTFIASQTLDDLVIASGRKAEVSANGDFVIRMDTLDLSLDGSGNPTATLDVKNNDLIVTGMTHTAVRNLIAYAYHAEAWDRAGITSASALASNPTNKMFGTVTGAQYKSANGATTAWHGAVPADTDILVKFTYYGDTDFNGSVNFDDYSRIDNGNGADWFRGDADYNGVKNFDDYSHIDNAFSTQDGVLLTGPGGGNPFLIALGQMEHFTQSYMWHFINWNEEHNSIFYTPEDFFPDGLPW